MLLRTLLKLRSDKDYRAQVRAAQELGASGNPRAVRHLLRQWKRKWGPSSDLAMEIYTAIGRIGGKRGLKALMEILAQIRKDHSVRLANSNAFSGGRVVVYSPLDSDAKKALGEALGALGAPAVRGLIDELFMDGLSLYRELMAVAFSRIGEPSVDPLLQALGKADRDDLIIEILGRIGRPALKAGPAIARVAGNPNKHNHLRTVATSALGKIGATADLDGLFGAFEKADLDLRLAFLGALAASGHPRAAEMLTAALKEEDTQKEAVGALAVLAKSGDRRAVEILAASLRDDNVQDAVAQTLERLGWHPDDEADRARLLIGLEKYHEAAQIGGPAVMPFRDILESSKLRPGSLQDALAAIVEMTVPIDVLFTSVFQLTKHPNAGVRGAAARILRDCGWRSFDASERAWFLVALAFSDFPGNDMSDSELDELARLGPLAADALYNAAYGDPPCDKATMDLAKTGDARAVPYLLAVVSAKGKCQDRYAEVALLLLRRILRKAARSISTDDLDRILELSHITMKIYDPETMWETVLEERVLPCEDLRVMARNELGRRRNKQRRQGI